MNARLEFFELFLNLLKEIGMCARLRSRIFIDIGNELGTKIDKLYLGVVFKRLG